MTNQIKQLLFLMILAYAFLVLGNGIWGLTDPDEVFYAQTAKEMIQHHSWLTPYLFDEPQFEKPVFAYWMIKVGFILFGISSFSARFFASLFAVIGVMAIYFLGLIGFKDEKKAFLSSMILMSSALYVGLSRILLTDMIFSVFILLSLLCFFLGVY